jgi:uncharacterized protein YdaT
MGRQPAAAEPAVTECFPVFERDVVAVLKGRVGEGVGRVVEEAINAVVGHDEGVEEDDDAADGEVDSATSTKDARERHTKQIVFDALYLQRFISTSTDATQGAGLDDAAMVRLRKNAGEYAKKTYLLFALLA